jgi:multimeric flavodoxin WrbA
MKVLAINGSPCKGQGNTAFILTPFLEGLREAGAEVELFYTKDLNINPCQGELNCWFKTPGTCSQQDDMQWLGSKLREADIRVFATPVFFWGVTGPLKNLIDRMLPMAEPFISLRNGHCSKPLRQGTKPAKVVLVSTCAFWEMDNFDPMLAHFQTLCRNSGFEFSGALLRPQGRTLRNMLAKGAPVGDVLDAAREAGRQLATTGQMSPDTLKIVSRPLLPLEQYLDLINDRFHKMLD